METNSIYERDESVRPDSEFLAGEFALLVPGNTGRMLDARRTPIRIESYAAEGALFRLRILKFEDTGTVWELPAEQIERFQFERDAKWLDPLTVHRIREEVEKHSGCVHIEPQTKIREASEAEVNSSIPAVRRWLDAHSEFLRSGAAVNLQAQAGPESLRRDCTAFFKERKYSRSATPHRRNNNRSVFS